MTPEARFEGLLETARGDEGVSETAS